MSRPISHSVGAPHHLPSLSEFDMMTTPSQVHIVDDSPESIGHPVTFSTGQFEGRTLRAELIELQKADLGRKYARKDRRPLDPPPVVQLKLFEVFNHGTQLETHREFESYDDLRGFGLLCHIDLFPVPAQDSLPPPVPSKRKGQSQSQSRTRPTSTSTASASASKSASPTTTPSPSYSLTHPQPSNSSFILPSFGGSNSNSYSIPPPLPSGPSLFSLPPPGNSGVTLPPISSIHTPSSYSSVHLPPMHAINRSNLTLPPLTRQHYSFPPPPPPPPVPIIQPAPPPSTSTANYGEGKAIRAGPNAPEGIVAYLGDHSIKEEEKCTDALVGARISQSSPLEYQGRKHISMFGVRLNLRETERKRRRGGRSDTASPGPSRGRGGRRKRRAAEEEDSDANSSDDEDDDYFKI
ncbi:hypothetical protein PHLCEN_2v5531 [Hermanssonia centrifuga]|uniref:Velvet domain-containing protein n=1 Tax=Hermanssonia centrifuga TaxID=98765 RepID=A0A2R6P2Q2_9APHY|nr:hypothetical protein PHLCEN_2v5531 [Hermanssonia centrifuga]